MVSVAVAAPSARFAALSLANRSRNVRGTRRSGDGARSRLDGMGMSQCIDNGIRLSIQPVTNRRKTRSEPLDRELDYNPPAPFRREDP